MARNSLAGSKKGTSKSAKYLHNNPEARKKKLAYDKKYQKSADRVKYRTALNKANAKSHASGKTRVGDGKDASHTKKGGLVSEAQSKNRARNGHNGKSTKK